MADLRNHLALGDKLACQDARGMMVQQCIMQAFSCTLGSIPAQFLDFPVGTSSKVRSSASDILKYETLQFWAVLHRGMCSDLQGVNEVTIHHKSRSASSS